MDATKTQISIFQHLNNEWEEHRYDKLLKFVTEKNIQTNTWWSKNMVNWQNITMDLLKIIRQNQNIMCVDIDVKEFSKSPNITLNIILQNGCTFGEKTEVVPDNQSLSIPYIIGYSYSYYHDLTFSPNPNVTWDWEGFCENSNLTLDFVECHPEISWNYDGLSCNPNVTMEYVMSNMEMPWNWANMSHSPNLTMEIILRFPDKGWKYDEISSHPNLTLDTVIQLKRKSWYWFAISKHEIVTLDVIEQYANSRIVKLDWDGIALNPNLTMEFIEKHNEIAWNWENISMNPNMKMETVEKYINKPWNWHRYLCKNPNLTIDMIVKYRHLFDTQQHSVYVHGITTNPNISFDDIANNPNLPWRLEYICRNPFTKDKTNFIEPVMGFVLLTAFMEHYDELPYEEKCGTFTSLEYIFFDQFLVKTLLKFW
jgi:hypothetical protein